MSARLIIGDVRAALATLPDESVDLVVSSPPFLTLRSYLPPDHPDKALEVGSESTPGEFLDVILDIVEACRRVLTPHGSLVFELGDTYAGSGGAGGDYDTKDPGEKAWREGQPKFNGSALAARRTRNANRPSGEHKPLSPRPKYNGGAIGKDRTDGGSTIIPERTRLSLSQRDGIAGWPLDKSACAIPELFHVALSYGLNPLTGRVTDRWRVRNFVAWCRPNPPVGADSDKFRRATSYLTVATMARDRYWDGDAVRVPSSANTHARTAEGVERRETTGKRANDEGSNGHWSTLDTEHSGDGTRPMYDYWELSTQGYSGSHYATWPEALVVPLVASMCPERVCRECGEPSRRIVERTIVPNVTRVTVGWTDCGHNSWRPGIVLDPFVGSGTTLQVATRMGREAIGIDLDPRNEDLCRARVGMFLADVDVLGRETVA